MQWIVIASFSTLLRCFAIPFEPSALLCQEFFPSGWTQKRWMFSNGPGTFCPRYFTAWVLKIHYSPWLSVFSPWPKFQAGCPNQAEAASSQAEAETHEGDPSGCRINDAVLKCWNVSQEQFRLQGETLTVITTYDLHQFFFSFFAVDDAHKTIQGGYTLSGSS